MSREPQLTPRKALGSIAAGLLLMAFFTMLWTGIACGSMASNRGIILSIFALVSMVFILAATSLLRSAKRFPKSESEQDKGKKKSADKWFWIIFGAEGLAILIAINLVINLGHADLTIPVIALVVGLHFYPLARIFRRTVDYYLATWTSIVAAIGIVMILNKAYSTADVDAFVGVGTAIATSCYGTYMIYNGKRLIRSLQGRENS